MSGQFGGYFNQTGTNSVMSLDRNMVHKVVSRHDLWVREQFCAIRGVYTVEAASEEISLLINALRAPSGRLLAARFGEGVIQVASQALSIAQTILTYGKLVPTRYQ